MLFKKVLVPIDGSEPSRSAIRLATTLAKDQGASIVFCHALDTVALLRTAEHPAVDTAPVISEAKQRAAALVREAEQQARAAGVSASSVTEEADTVPFVLSCGKTQGADLIVMGTHGRSGLAHAFLGSTAEGVLRGAAIPVMVVTRH